MYACMYNQATKYDYTNYRHPHNLYIRIIGQIIILLCVLSRLSACSVYYINMDTLYVLLDYKYCMPVNL